MLSKREKTRKIRRECPSIGSDESGTGGLFGGCSFAAFKLTKDNLEKIKSFDWYSKIKDSKDLSDKENMDISEAIKESFLNGVDYCIWNMEVIKYNQTFFRVLKEYKNNSKRAADRVKCIGHNFVHKKIDENMAFHIADNFLDDETQRYIDECPNPELIIPIDHFCDKGGYRILSVAIASILARGSYLKNLENLRQTLGIEISDDDNHRDEHDNFKPSKLEPIFKQLEERGISREYVYSSYCKADLVRRYKKQLESYKSQLKN